ncbi:MAG: GGDEF domain-containing protein [Acidobacteriota bacterium]|nr:GGDEF domain-containing protein [Acidobacteriota bacterium]
MPGEPHDSSLLPLVLDATRALELGECLARIARGALDLFPARFSLAYSITASGEDLECVAAAGDGGGEDDEPLRLVRLAFGLLDADLVRHLASDGSALLDAADVLVPTGEDEALPPLGAALLVPLESSTSRIGLLLLLLEPGREAPAAWRERATGLERELRPALDNVKEVEMLRQLVVRDDTTDCYNRRCLEENLDEEVERARRFGGRFAVIFLDMDNLKEVNTVHGHAAGSKVLRDASVRIGRTIRSIDRLYRYGGDEFVTILPGTDLDGAREVAERIRGELSNQPFEIPPGARVTLTASTGIAVWPDHSGTGRGVVKAADDAMRRVKASGKDGVESATSEAREGGSSKGARRRAGDAEP